MAKDCKKCLAYENALSQAIYERDQALEQVAELQGAAQDRGDGRGDSLFEVNERKSKLVYILTGKRM